MTPHEAMTLHDFDECLDRFGGDLASWPDRLRTGAEELLDRSSEAQQMLRDVAEIERGLRAYSAALPLPPAVASRAMRHPQVSTRRAGLQRAAWGALAVAVLAIGILVGQGNAGRFAPGSGFDTADESAAQIVAAALDPSDSIDVD